MVMVVIYFSNTIERPARGGARWQPNPAECETIRVQAENQAMSALGQKRTCSDTLSNVCFWGQSGHPMAAF